MARKADPHAHEALRDAAIREFSRHGILSARIEDITKAAGLSKGAFYLHHESKEALFGEVANELTTMLDGLLDARRAAHQKVFERVGPPKGRAVKPEYLQAFADVDAQYDLATLEALWNNRFTVDVLMRGSRGTEFEGYLWAFSDREMKRVTEEIELSKQYGLCRQEIPSEVIGAMVVGTWLLMARSMTEREKPPDFAFWVSSLKQLINQGIAPPALLKTNIKKKRGARR